MLPNLTVTTAAKSRSLCLLSSVKAELGIATADTSNDTRISTLIRGASLIVETVLGREPWLQTYAESRPGQGGTYLYLSRFPVNGEASSVTWGTGDSPETITASTYSMAGRKRDRVYRADGWSQTGVDEDQPIASIQALAYNIAYSAGWVMPDQVTDADGTITAWASTTAYAAGAWLQDAADPDAQLIFEVTTAGTSDSSEPTWSSATADGDTITDGTVVWTAREQRLPDSLEIACKMLVVDWFGGFAPANVQFEALESWSIRYMGEQKALSGAVASLVRPYR